MEIYVNLNKLPCIGSSCMEISNQICRIEYAFRTLSQQVDSTIKREQNIGKEMENLAQKLKAQSRALEFYSQFIEDACSDYAQLNSSAQSSGSWVDVQAAVPALHQIQKEDESFLVTLLSLLTQAQLSFDIGSLSCLKSSSEAMLGAFFGGDLLTVTGAADTVGLTDELYCSLADTKEQVSHTSEVSAAIDTAGSAEALSLAQQANDEAMRTLNAALENFEDPTGAPDTLQTAGSVDPSEVVGEVLAASGEAGDLLKAAYEEAAAVEEVAESGLTSPAALYNASAREYLISTMQHSGGDSVTSTTTVEVSTPDPQGLTASTTVGTTSTVDSLSFGLLSLCGEGVIDVDALAHAAEAFALAAATKAGNHLCQSEQLRQTYLNGGALVKAMLAFAAAAVGFKS